MRTISVHRKMEAIMIEYVELNNSRYGIVASAEKAFSFNASYYTQEELEKKTHNYELTESDSVVFCVDYALNGIGLTVIVQVVLDQYDLMMYYFGSSLLWFRIKGIIKFQVTRKQGKRVWLFCKIRIHRTIRQKQNKRKI